MHVRPARAYREIRAEARVPFVAFSLSPQLYVTFWALCMFDLHVPTERYEQELSKLKQQQNELDDNKEMVSSPQSSILPYVIF